MNSYVYFMAKRGRRNPEETRQKIVEAAVAAHEEVGPADTTITAIAERAGVQRLTVYRHFPEEDDILEACSSHWTSEHPLPDPSEWAGLENPALRLRTAMEAVFQYYRNGEGMLRKVLRDEEEIPSLVQIMRPYHGWFRELAAQLSTGWGNTPETQRIIRAAVSHSLRFETWDSLAGEGLSDEEAAHILTVLVASVAEAPLP